MPFHDRSTELSVLDRLWSSGRAEFLVLYGRRRIGKTELLTHFTGARRSIYLEATDVRAQDQLADFGAAYALGLGFGSAVPLVSSWASALELIAEATQENRTVVVLDEFQYLEKQTPGLASTIARWWREVGRQRQIVFILAGSDVAFFADEVLGANAALHGRRTADLQLQPFGPREAPLFFPSWSSEDRVRAYAVWGGVPYYLNFIDEAAPLETNILDTTLVPGAPLANEAEYLIRMESRLRDVALYGSVLRAIAGGQTQAAAIANHLRVDLGNLSRQIDRLVAVGLVKQARPVTRARKTDVLLQIADPFLRFWFRYVATAGAQVATADRAQRYLRRVVAPALDEFVSAPAFEEICQHYVLHASDASLVGRWWGPVTERETSSGSLRNVDREADVVALDDAGVVVALGACKWSNAPVQVYEVNKLRRIAQHLQASGDVALYVFHRAGVDDRIREEDVHVVGPDDLYA